MTSLPALPPGLSAASSPGSPTLGVASEDCLSDTAGTFRYRPPSSCQSGSRFLSLTLPLPL